MAQRAFTASLPLYTGTSFPRLGNQGIWWCVGCVKGWEKRVRQQKGILYHVPHLLVCILQFLALLGWWTAMQTTVLVSFNASHGSFVHFSQTQVVWDVPCQFGIKAPLELVARQGYKAPLLAVGWVQSPESPSICRTPPSVLPEFLSLWQGNSEAKVGKCLRALPNLDVLGILEPELFWKPPSRDTSTSPRKPTC